MYFYKSFVKKFFISFFSIAFLASATFIWATTGFNVQTNSVTGVYTNYATFQGITYNIDSGKKVSAWFEWGTDTSYGNKTVEQTLNYAGSFSQMVSTLKYKTIYHFRAIAKDEFGIFYYGQDVIFISGTSTSLTPIADAGPAQYTRLGQSVVLKGSGYDPYGGGISFSWKCSDGKLSDYGIAQPSFTPPTINFNDSSYSSNSYNYYYSCTLTIISDRGYSTMSTTSVIVNGSTLTVKTDQPTNIFNNQATLNGYANTAISNISYVWFQWGTTLSYGNETLHRKQENSGSVEQNIAGLKDNNTYHYRMAGQNIYGNFVYGDDVSFVGSSVLVPYTSKGSFTRYLGYRDSGSDVVALQKILAKKGFFKVTATGKYGPITVAAVKILQQSYGLSQTGNVGPLTKNILNQLSTSSILIN
ncbi:MAG: hypothetical protein A3C58_01380 [Candidatus Staskawiczbacteria bacterium RIFCSPHIGHO2_02_FULL_34_10]|uniref:Peptidoglycan binding-like domain-containing protein n=2 Tax=Candidatus Staskawicziibacteriota TaxID=1817916 RepID=A0A1G2HKM5_9BACT|nr:MAG: hypothetical protein A2639_01675 [Candidatus Staskawiczbacteria bacterium RIFCSPHIGHO2_01_FULL_34_27]OGZ67833.1 MAG: hypothetical protein A3C58_01380 [Candidatus Staskawiczbacteria bacterium RIFCSPHIGHO2_02_FULL_34_10]